MTARIFTGPWLHRHARHAALISSLAITTGVASLVQAQTQTAKPPASVAAPNMPLSLRGKTFDGHVISLAERRGKVVMLYFWRTACAVCRDKLPELRNNAAGWAGQPFELISVSMDRRRADALAYQSASDAVLRPDQRFASLWHGDIELNEKLPAHGHKLPYTVVIDPQGKVAKTFEGRIPAEAWDLIAELLP